MTALPKPRTASDDRSPCESLVHLDKKLSRALSNGRGINLTADDLELMASLGVPSRIAEAKAHALEEQARCRRLRVVSTNGANSGSNTCGGPTAGQPAPASTSGGTTPPPDDSSAKARANQMFG